MSVAAEAPRTAERVRILIVDDADAILQTLARLLQTVPDFEVVGSATNGEEGVRRAQELQPDVVLMDVRMPGMDGVTAAREILAHIPGTSVVMLSAYDDRALVSESMQVGAAGFVLKGAPFSEIANTLRAASRMGSAPPGAD